MNLVGKILVLVVLVMSVMFMAFAVAVYSTHTDWKKVADDLKKKLDEAQLHNAALNERMTQIAQDIDTQQKQYQGQIAKLESERIALREAVATSKQEVENLSLDLRNQSALAAAKTEESNRKEKLINQQREEITQIENQRDTHARDVVSLTDKFNQAVTENQRLEMINARLAEQNALAKRHLDLIGKSIDTPIDDVPPKIDGVVLAVGRDGLIEISLGSDDGLSRGHTLEVYRGKNYLGRAEVIVTQPDKAVAKLLPTHQQGKIEKEDRVATRFN